MCWFEREAVWGVALFVLVWLAWLDVLPDAELMISDLSIKNSNKPARWEKYGKIFSGGDDYQYLDGEDAFTHSHIRVSFISYFSGFNPGKTQ